VITVSTPLCDEVTLQKYYDVRYVFDRAPEFLDEFYSELRAHFGLDDLSSNEFEQRNDERKITVKPRTYS
jgi:hypothetical protein